MYLSCIMVQKANITEISTRQCTDSCLEFFVKPFPEKDDRYMNIEISASGVPYVGLGPGRGMGTKFKGLVEGMDVSASDSTSALASVGTSSMSVQRSPADNA